MSNISNPLERACLLVGQFLYHFARVEQKIDQAVIKLLDLDKKTAPIVALIDFGRKAELVRKSAYEELHDSKKEKEKIFAKDVCNRVYEMNNHRRILAHASFEPASGGGVLFSRPVTEKGSVRPVTEPWTEKHFTTLYGKMTALEADLDKLIELIKPVKPVPFDWYVPWQETHSTVPLTLLRASQKSDSK
jgi:hypothetical protein